MAFFESFMEWSRVTFLPFGEIGLFLVAFTESSFFPIPPDLILIPLVMLNPGAGLYYALICTVGSVLGAVLGYYIGERGGRPALRRLVSERKIKKVEDYFDRYGVLAVGIAAFTPIPYKIFTIASGIFRVDLKKVLAVSFFCRGARFFPEAIILMLFGEQIMGLMSEYFEIATLIIGLAIIAFIWFYETTWKKWSAK